MERNKTVAVVHVDSPMLGDGIPTIEQIIFGLTKDFQVLASKQASGMLSLRELVEGIAEVGRKSAYWHNRAEKLAMREMYRQATAHEKDKFYTLASSLPKSAV